ncbi:MAG: hypothetical protein GYB66_06165 [Chloroflexi bacterium]|nr:hypothetical protein [Chloroflexota bacterium]
MQRKLFPFLMVLTAALACNLTRDPVPPTPIPPTLTPDQTATALAVLPTATATSLPSPTLPPSNTPTPTSTLTPTITPTPLPSSTPLATVAYAGDNRASKAVPNALIDGLDRAWLSFTVSNSQSSPEEGTAQPEESTQSVYLIRPDTGERVEIVTLPQSTGDRIYWSPTGMHLVYFIDPAEGAGGLYLLDLQRGREIRLFEADNLQPRGIIGHAPQWSPDGTRLALALPTAYATDIFLLNADGTGFENLTDSPSYDFWPAWSPDGTTLAFVSDRVECPTWIPGTPGTCDKPDATAPSTGNLFTYDLESGQVRKITDRVLNSPPRWINNNMLSVSMGSLDPLASVSELWVYDVAAGSSWQVSPADGALYSAPAWTNDGERLVYQRIGQGASSIILADRFGSVLASIDEYIFVRYGLSISWAPDGDFVALAGSNGQCPYGIIVLTGRFQRVTDPATNLLACDVVYSPEGSYLAYEGIRVARGTDGRLDVYIANTNGLGARAATANLEGTFNILGWVGPTFRE